jgi:hypothetical protein
MAYVENQINGGVETEGKDRRVRPDRCRKVIAPPRALPHHRGDGGINFHRLRGHFQDWAP